MRPIGSLYLYCHLRRIRTAELCVIAASILTAGTDMNTSNSLLTHCDAAQARVQRKLDEPKRGVDDKRLQGLGEGSVADVVMLRENKDGDGEGNEAHIKILPVILNVGHCFGRDNKNKTCGLNRLAKDLCPTFTSNDLLAIHAERRCNNG
jgi:hypothetical protein